MQQQTMGAVTAPLEEDTRKLTATDAAVCAPFVDALLAQAADVVETAQDRALLEGYSFGAQVDAPRLLLLALEEVSYQVVQLTIDMAGGKRQGHLKLCLPVMAEEAKVRVPQEVDGGVVPVAPRMDQTVLGLNVELRVALGTVQMPLGEVQALAAGMVLDLGVSSFDQASVVTRAGRRLGGGSLGQTNGVRAVQLEHQSQQSGRLPRRRAADRAGLSLPPVTGDGTGTREKAGQVGPVVPESGPVSADTMASHSPRAPAARN